MKKLFSQLNRAEINIPVTILWFALAVVYIGGLFVPLFDDDSAHHAAIALEMYNRGDWACLMDHENTPYLDKPHFQFWLVALSFQLFGVGGFAYKLSSFLFTLLGVWATYRLALHLCGRKAALYAALILASSAAFVLANIDVRMDAILTACIALAVWQGVMHLDTGKVRYLLGAALGMAMAFGTKGWIGVMVPFFALVFYIARQRQWRWFLSWRFLLLLAAFALFISPVLYAYYLQFDAHPELAVRGETGVSGVRFILWGQIFDRMGGTFGTTGANDPFFFLHTLLWAVLPWSFLFYVLLVKKVVEVSKGQSPASPVYWLTVPAILLTIAALSVSQFKLPHYLNVVFPLLAIFVAAVLTEPKTERFLRGIGIDDPERMARIRRRKVEIYPTHFDLVSLNEPLWEFVQDFRRQGGAAWIVSTGHLDNISNVMKHLGLENGVDGILSSDSVEHSKPAPDCFLKAMELAGATPAETLIFEDSEIGLEAAKASGAAYVRVTLPF